MKGLTNVIQTKCESTKRDVVEYQSLGNYYGIFLRVSNMNFVALCNAYHGVNLCFWNFRNKSRNKTSSLEGIYCFIKHFI